MKEQLESRYGKLYGEGDHSERIAEIRRTVFRRYMLVLLLFFLTVGWSIVSETGKEDFIIKTKQGLMVQIQRPDKGEDSLVIPARVKATGEKGSRIKETQIVVSPRSSSVDTEEGPFADVQEVEPYSLKLDRRISSAVRNLNMDTSGRRVVLPEKLADGTALQWQEAQSKDILLLVCICLIALAVVYRSRFDALKKEETAAEESVIRCLPEFINEIVLLLNAGIVINGAFFRLMDDYEKMRTTQRSYFYEQMHGIYIRMQEANSSLEYELKAFAKRSGVRELLRLSNIISDSLNKGADLTEKLHRESEMLWFSRKKRSEEKGRLAETKMTLPLMVLILVLVMITISPALLEM